MPPPSVSSRARPRLVRHVRLSFDRSRGQHVLLRPESVVLLNETGADIIRRCDGQRTVADIVQELHGHYDQVVEDEVRRFVDRLVAKRCLEVLDG